MSGTGFESLKHSILEELKDSAADKSPKGSVDAPIVSLLHDVNALDDFVTTSSCSGRVALFQSDESDEEGDPEGERSAPRKGHGSWLGVNHDMVWEADQVEAMLQKSDAKNLVFKMEPFVLHVLCRNQAAAQQMLTVARDCGFRESGISIGQKKIILGIRTIANALEVPLVYAGERIVSVEGLRGLCAVAKAKFDANASRWKTFHSRIKAWDDVAKNMSPNGTDNDRESNTEQGDIAIVWNHLHLHGGAEAEHLLLRYDHTATALDDSRILVQGGLGISSAEGSNRHGRLDDLVLLEKAHHGQWNATRIPDAVGKYPLGPSKRVRHSFSLVDQRYMILFGGRHGPSSPLNDFHVLDLESFSWLEVDVRLHEGETIKPRWGHTATALSNGLYIFGGRNAEQLFNDLWHVMVESVDKQKVALTLKRVQARSGPSPAARYLHSASQRSPTSFVLHGGYGDLLINEEGLDGIIYEDIFVFDANNETWLQACTSMPCPGFASRFSHQTVMLDENKLVLLGGVTRALFESCAALFDFEQKVWHRLPSSDNYGCSDPPVSMLQKATVTRLGDNLIAVGGGANCFSFGSYFSPPLVADISSLVGVHVHFNAVLCEPSESKTVKTLLEQAKLYDKKRRIALFSSPNAPLKQMAVPVLNQESISKALDLLKANGFASVTPVFAHLPNAKSLHQQKHKVHRPIPMPSTTKAAQERHHKEKEEQGESSSTVRMGPCVTAPARLCKAVKVALENAELYDRRRTIGSVQGDKSVLALPIFEDAQQDKVIAAVESVLGAGQTNIVQQELALAKVERMPQGKKMRLRRDLTHDGSTSGATTTSRFGVPTTLRAQITEWLRRTIPPALLKDESRLKKEIPNKVEILQDVAILPRESFRTPSLWEPIIAEGQDDQARCIWAAIARFVGASRVLRQNKIDPGVKRQSRAKLVFPRNSHPGDAFVSVKQNGVMYSFDMEKCMFSSGNITEKQRVAKFPCQGQTVVDLFAGIGYFTLPYLVKAKAAHVHACEWNADSLEALRGNLLLNKVEPERCSVHPGDCRTTVQTKLRGVADRVNLGLIPSSEPFWESGVIALRVDRGGWLHIHENVDHRERTKWLAKLQSTLEALCAKVHCEPWNVQVAHVERVKSYSPHVDHLVVDVLCTPPGVSTQEVKSTGALVEEVHHRKPYLSRIMYAPRSGKSEKRPSVQVVPFPTTREEASALFDSKEPVVMQGVLSKEVLSKWSIDSLLELCERNSAAASKKVSVHVSDPETKGKISFVEKSFSFQVMEFKQLIESMKNPDSPCCYLRAVGPNPRKDRAHFWKDFAEVAEHCGFAFPSDLVDKEKDYFSSVFRVASKGLQLWTHYDVMRNVLFQMHGRKRVVLFRPEHVGALDFHGSTSSITDIDNLDGLDENCPFAKARAEAYEITLEPGQALYIPALWPHNARAEENSVAINIFWKHLSDAHYGSKDLYGNRDPLLAEKALELVAKAKDVLHSAQDDGTTLPQEYVDFYTEMAACTLHQ